MEEDVESGEELDLSFTGVTVHSPDLILVTAIVDEYAEDKQDHAIICFRMNGAWKLKGIENSIIGICVLEDPKRKVLHCGVDGEIEVASLPGWSKEYVNRSDDGPSYSLHLKTIRRIGGHVYVAGMGRQVYRRNGPEQWARIDAGVFVPRSQRKKSVGFNAIDGFDEKRIYAVGYHGEIWYYNGKNWRQQESPTNLLLACVKCAPDGKVYACGQAGVLLVGSDNRWRIVEQDLTGEDFWGIAYFQDKVWVSNADGIFVLNDGAFRRVDLRCKEDISTCYLDATNNAIWAVGEKDILFSNDGIRWKRLDSPQFFE